MYSRLAVPVALLIAAVVLAEENKLPAAPAQPITGQCHCGQIKYEAQGPAVEGNYCDCRGCQRATGTMKSAILVVKSAGFKIVAGEPTAFRATKGEKCDKYGTLDDLTLFQPKR